MNHLSWDDAWKVVDGEEDDEVIALLRHASSCPSCQKLLDEVRSMDQSLRAALSPPPDVAQPQNEDELWEGLLMRLDTMDNMDGRETSGTPFEDHPMGQGHLTEGSATSVKGSAVSVKRSTTRRKQARSRHWGVFTAGVSAALVIGGVMMGSMMSSSSANNHFAGFYTTKNLALGGPSTASSSGTTTHAVVTNSAVAPLGRSSVQNPGNTSTTGKASSGGTTGTAGTAGTMQSAMSPASKKPATNSGTSITSSQMAPSVSANHPAGVAGRFQVQVVDKQTGGPVSDANVIVVTASGITTVTHSAKTGYTREIDVQSLIDGWTSKPTAGSGSSYDWPNLGAHGEVAVVVTRAGYRPTILYHVPIGGGMTPKVVSVPLSQGTGIGAKTVANGKDFTAIAYPLKSGTVASLMQRARGVSQFGPPSIPLTAGGADESRIVVHVKDLSGQPVAGSRVIVYDKGRVEALAITGKRGTASVRGTASSDWGLPTGIGPVKWGRVAVLVVKPGVGAWWNFDVGTVQNAVTTLTVTLTNDPSTRSPSIPPASVSAALIRFVNHQIG